MQRQCNHVTLANFAQTLNVVGMLVVTPEAVLRETVFWALQMQRHHSGDVAIDAWTECDTSDITTDRGQAFAVPYLDVSATRDEARGKAFVSISNLHRTEAIETAIVVGNKGAARTFQLSHAAPFAKNTFEAPDTIVPVETAVESRDGTVSLRLPPHSYTILEVEA